MFTAAVATTTSSQTLPTYCKHFYSEHTHTQSHLFEAFFILGRHRHCRRFFFSMVRLTTAYTTTACP